jgi:hypothetical protein
MKLWAKLDDDNIVVEIIEETDEDDQEGPLAPGTGKLGIPAERKQGLVRVLSEGPAGTYAAPGFKYDTELKGFVPPRPDATDIFDANKFQWLPAKPDETNDYYWDDSKQTWIKVDN